MCGREGRVGPAPSLRSRLRGWLVDGQVPRPTLQCAQGHEWAGGSTRWLRLRREPWWSWPARAMRVVLGHRTAEPVPLLWLMAAGAGVVLGVIAQLTLGWPWWLVAVLWLMVVWLIFLSTALSPMGRDRLWIELVATVSPARAERLELDLLLRSVEATPGPPYGLAEWTGLRWLGGHRRSSLHGLTRLELVYGEPPDQPHVRVDTHWKRPDRRHRELEMVRGQLVEELQGRRISPPDGLSPEEFHAWALQRRLEYERRPPPEWSRRGLLIDGTPQHCDALVEGEDWVALVELTHVVVAVVSHGVPAQGIALTRVVDLGPYVAGAAELRRRHNSRHPPR